MKTSTLDGAYEAMSAEPDDASHRLRFYECIMACELHLIIEAEPKGGHFEPAVYDTSDGRFVLAFDSTERLAEFAKEPTPTLLLPGRTLISMLLNKGLGLSINLGVSPSSTLLDAKTVAWMAGMIATHETVSSGQPLAFGPPEGLSAGLRKSLEAKLALFPGIADEAIVATAAYEGSRRRLMAALIDVPRRFRGSLAAALAEATAFSGEEGLVLDVVFFDSDSPLTAEIRRVGQQLKLADPAKVEKSRPATPGSDPDRPPILR